MVKVRARPRWWRSGLSLVTLLVAGGILIIDWSANLASHPAYLVTLLVLIFASVVAGATGLLDVRATARPPERSLPGGGWRRVAHGCGVVALLLLLAALVYLRPLHASPVAVEAMAGSPQVHVVDSANRIELSPTSATRTTGLVFYPGAKVDPRAYVPNLTPIAAAGYPVIILKVPYNIAFAGRNAAFRAMDAEPTVTRWVVGGHSLGGVVASSVAGSNDPRVRGLLLWASYPNSTLADRPSLQATSISGWNDGLATPAKVDAAKAKLPPDTRYVVIDGGIHSFFGDYGLQSGDGTPSVSRHAAQEQIQTATLELMQRVADEPP